MLRDLQRYLTSAQLVDIIYLDRSGQITQRRIKLHSITDDQVKAYCFYRRSIRSFSISNILAIAATTFMKGA